MKSEEDEPFPESRGRAVMACGVAEGSAATGTLDVLLGRACGICRLAGYRSQRDVCAKRMSLAQRDNDLPVIYR